MSVKVDAYAVIVLSLLGCILALVGVAFFQSSAAITYVGLGITMVLLTGLLVISIIVGLS